jgi:hypothetical protein
VGALLASALFSRNTAVHWWIYQYMFRFCSYLYVCLTSLYAFQRLASGEWFTARVSSCGLFHIAYPSATDPLKTELRTIYGQLCQDDMPMVRRAAASNLGKFAATVEQSHLKTEIMSIFDDLTQDGTSLYIFDVLFYKLVFCRFMQIVIYLFKKWNKTCMCWFAIKQFSVNWMFVSVITWSLPYSAEPLFSHLI